MKKSYKSFVKLSILIILLVLYLLNSSLIIENVLNYTNLFITKLMPTTLVIYIFSSLLIDLGIINYLNIFFKNKSPIIYTIFISLISGFPSGSKVIKDLLDRKYIDLDTANYLIRFTHFSNPLFILGSLKPLFNNNYNVLILLSLIISNFIIAIIFKKKLVYLNSSNYVELSFSNSLSRAIKSSLNILVNIYGTSIFFILILEIINHYFNFSIPIYVLLNGIFDLTKGSFSTALINDNNIRAIFIILFNSLGSIPIHLQIKSIILDTEISYKNFFLSRIMQIPIAIIVFILLTYRL